MKWRAFITAFTFLMMICVTLPCYARPGDIEVRRDGNHYIIRDGEAYFFDDYVGESAKTIVVDNVEYPVTGIYYKMLPISRFNLPHSSPSKFYFHTSSSDDDGYLYIPSTFTKYIRDDFEVNYEDMYYFASTQTGSLLEFLRHQFLYPDLCCPVFYNEKMGICVEEGNPEYSSYEGILYNADGSEMLMIQGGMENVVTSPKCTHIPSDVCLRTSILNNGELSRKNSVRSIVFSESVEEIDALAFSECEL